MTIHYRADTSKPSGIAVSRPPRPARRHLLAPAEMTVTGEVKWYDRTKKFGFVETDKGDVFLHWSIVQLYGLREQDLVPGLPVRVKAEQKPGKRPEVTAIAIER